LLDTPRTLVVEAAVTFGNSGSGAGIIVLFHNLVLLLKREAAGNLSVIQFSDVDV
jgi:hypothetical protein